MLKNLSQLEVKIGEKLYHLSCDMDSPIEHVKEAVFQFLKFIGSIEDAAKAQADAAKAQVQSEVAVPAVEAPVVEESVA